MTERTDDAQRRRRERPEPTPEERAEADRQFAARLSDWSDPGAIVLIRRGGEPVAPELPLPLDNTVPAVDRIDDDGNLILEDGSIIVG